MRQIDLRGVMVPLPPKRPEPNVIQHIIIPELWCEGDLTPHGKVPLFCDKPKNFGPEGQCRECFLVYLEHPEWEDEDEYCTIIKQSKRTANSKSLRIDQK